MNPYEIMKLLYPVTTTAKNGVDVQELIKEKYALHYEKLRLDIFDWENDLDGILDFLYGECEIGFLCFLCGVPKSDISGIIKLIEENCEVKK